MHWLISNKCKKNQRLILKHWTSSIVIEWVPGVLFLFNFVLFFILMSVNKQCITKTCLYNFDPLKPHFYIVKLGFTGVYIIFLISAQNIDCGYSLEPPHGGGSNEYPQSMF